MRKKVDAIQGEVIKALRKAGMSVVDLSSLGRGIPDLLVSSYWKVCLIECKAPGKNLNKLQQEFFKRWQGEVITVTSPEQAVQYMQIPRNKEY